MSKKKNKKNKASQQQKLKINTNQSKDKEIKQVIKKIDTDNPFVNIISNSELKESDKLIKLESLLKDNQKLDLKSFCAAQFDYHPLTFLVNLHKSSIEKNKEVTKLSRSLSKALCDAKSNKPNKPIKTILEDYSRLADLLNVKGIVQNDLDWIQKTRPSVSNVKKMIESSLEFLQGAIFENYIKTHDTNAGYCKVLLTIIFSELIKGENDDLQKFHHVHKENLLYLVNSNGAITTIGNILLIDKLSEGKLDLKNEEEIQSLYFVISIIEKLGLRKEFLTYKNQKQSLLLKFLNTDNFSHFELLVQILHKINSAPTYLKSSVTIILEWMANETDVDLIKAFVRKYLKSDLNSVVDEYGLNLCQRAIINDNKIVVKTLLKLDIITNLGEFIKNASYCQYEQESLKEILYEYVEKLVDKQSQIDNSSFEERCKNIWNKMDKLFQNSTDKKPEILKGFEKIKTQRHEQQETKFKKIYAQEQLEENTAFNLLQNGELTQKAFAAYQLFKKKLKGTTDVKEEVFSWCLNEGTEKEIIYKSSDEAIHQYSYDGSDYYFIIEDGVIKDKKTCELFVNALENGICKHSLGDNGIKFINDMPELKVSTLNLRLYPKSIYIGESHGKYLVIFNKTTNHTQGIPSINNNTYKLVTGKVDIKISEVHSNEFLNPLDIPSFDESGDKEDLLGNSYKEEE
jgi:hypothetical protein